MILDFATGGLRPDLTLYLDIDVETGLKRKRTGADEWNRMDDLEVEFHRRVQRGYLEMISQEPARWMVVDAARDAGTIAKDIRDIVEERLVLNEKRQTSL
jgi:dTMP kinase